MIKSIEREGTKVVIRIDTGLDIDKKIIILNYETNSEIYAELLKLQLWDQREKFQKQIAQSVIKYPLLYLTCEEVSKLKSMLIKEWNGAKHCWK